MNDEHPEEKRRLARTESLSEDSRSRLRSWQAFKDDAKNKSDAPEKNYDTRNSFKARSIPIVLAGQPREAEKVCYSIVVRSLAEVCVPL